MKWTNIINSIPFRMLKICLSLLSTLEQLESLTNKQGKDLSDNTVTDNDTLAGSDEYQRVAHKRKYPDHVFLRFGRGLDRQ
jgi:hypothetical protein